MIISVAVGCVNHNKRSNELDPAIRTADKNAVDGLVGETGVIALTTDIINIVNAMAATIAYSSSSKIIVAL